MGRDVVRCGGEAGLDVGTLRKEAGAATVFVVAGSTSDANKPWQRLFVSWTGAGSDWVAPNFMIMRPDGETPAPFKPHVFLVEHDEVVLDNIHIAIAAQGSHQGFVGDVAEVLVFDHHLRFDEMIAVQDYLRGKWGIVSP